MMEEIVKHFESVAPDEGCGFLLKDGSFVPVDNMVEGSGITPEIAKRENISTVSFLIPAKEYIKHSRDIKAIVHSHCYAEADDWTQDGPSVSDQKHQFATGVPWEIYVLSANKVVDRYAFNFGKPAYIGETPYRPGVVDEIAAIELWHGPVNIYRDISTMSKPGWLQDVSERLVLSGRFEVLPEGAELEDKDVLFYGETKTSGIDSLLVYLSETEGYQQCTREGGIQWVQTPAKSLYRHLRKL